MTFVHPSMDSYNTYHAIYFSCVDCHSSSMQYSVHCCSQQSHHLVHYMHTLFIHHHVSFGDQDPTVNTIINQTCLQFYVCIIDHDVQKECCLPFDW